MTARDPGPSPRDAKALIHNLLRHEMADVCQQLGQPAYRASQLWNWLYVAQCTDWSEMKNLPAALRADMGARFALPSAVPIHTEGPAEATRKILVQLHDGEAIEEVLIPAAERRTVCVSSQAGCRYRCAFCASGQAGFRRQLEAGEMVGQVLVAARAYGGRPTHVVFMGIGEPFDNYDNVLKAIRIINDPDGLGIGARRITVSTCGLIPGIQRLAGEGLQIELSVSLHAPSDDLRAQLMPVNRKFPLKNLLAACKAYSAATGRIITFEYTLIHGVNDTPGHARELTRLLSSLPCRVNLIPLSQVEEFRGDPSSPETARMFIDVLDKAGINATLRASKGCSLKAACGQLRYGRSEREQPS